MLSHVIVGANDLDRAKVFYDAVFAALGFACIADDLADGWIGYRKGPDWAHADGSRNATFWVTRPLDGAAAAAGNGVNVGFEAPARAAVDAAHAAALAHGGTCDGPPGLRRYHAHFYGAYMRDPDGNKLCIVHHHPE